MKPITVVQTFTSLEGEGPLTGTPTFYIRLSGCNKKCLGFNNPDMLETTNENLGFDPKSIMTLREMPPITKGCDTIYGIDSRFKHLWKKTDWEEAMADYREGDNLSITGGEPSLWQSQIIEFLDSPLSDDIPNIIFETNCSVPIKADFIDAIQDWSMRNYRSIWWWANSPKLSISGEDWSDSIVPSVAVTQVCANLTEQYFKFVTDGSKESMEEINKAIYEFGREINTVGDPINPKIWLMPVACNKSQQDFVATQVANLCIEKQYKFAFRLQNQLWDNDVDA